MWYTREHHVGTLLCAEVCAALLQNVLVCVCACEGGCHGHHPKKVCVHRDLPCTSGEASEVSQQFDLLAGCSC